MARWPAAGRCKTRLATDLSELGLNRCGERAARLQQQLTEHTMSVAAGLSREGYLQLVLAVSGLGPRASARWGSSLLADQTRRQSQGTLGCRMRHLLLMQQGSRNRCAALLIGTDLPELNRLELLTAIEQLQDHDLVLGPANDGGYWLIGLAAAVRRQPQRWPLSGIVWGESNVLDQTLQLASDRGLRTALLSTHNDLDRVTDLDPWLD